MGKKDLLSCSQCLTWYHPYSPPLECSRPSFSSCSSKTLDDAEVPISKNKGLNLDLFHNCSEDIF